MPNLAARKGNAGNSGRSQQDINDIILACQVLVNAGMSDRTPKEIITTVTRAIKKHYSTGRT